MKIQRICIKLKVISSWLLLGLLICSCSTHSQHSHNTPGKNYPPGLQGTNDQYWYRFGFNIAWPEDTEINWTMDLLIAHAIVAPVLQKHSDDISYWRFHRRAARDQTGHSFTFMAYCSQGVSALMLDDFAQSTLLKKIVEEGFVTKLLVDNPTDNGLINIEDTSDRNWSESMQRNWPSFIMGVSALWLGLIDDAVTDSAGSGDDVQLMLKRYESANEKITEIWTSEGQHALLHHLNALFGYKPLYIRKFISF